MFDLIYSVFGYPLGWVMFVCYKIIPIYGVALILFTVIVRLCLAPIAVKQQKSMIKMQMVRPRMEEIQKKYANNREKMNEEMAKFYQEENFNPMSGCLPMLVQMPILFGLYDVIQKPMTHLLRIPAEAINAAKEVATGVLGLADGALLRDYSAQLKIIDAFQKDPGAFSAIGDFSEKMGTLSLNFFGLDLTQMPSAHGISTLLIIPVLSLATSFLMTMFTMKQQGSAAADAPGMNGMTKGMMYLMPLMSGYFAYILPAGLGVYWVISNILSAIQTWLLSKYMNPVKMAAEARAAYEERREQERREKIETRKKARENGESIDKARSQKEINRMKLAESRQRMSEKYGDVYQDVTDDDLK